MQRMHHSLLECALSSWGDNAVGNPAESQARRNPIYLCRKDPRVNVRFVLQQWLTPRVDLLAVMIVGEKVGLDGREFLPR